MDRTTTGTTAWRLPGARRAIAAALLAPVALSSTGCFWGLTSGGPSLGVAAVPIPISPFQQKKQEDQYWVHERYDRVPILGPIPPGGTSVALDEPSDDEVMRALEAAQPVQGGIPFLWTRNRNNVKIIKCKIADHVDPVRVYPLIGPAQHHHARYKCTVYYEDVRRVGWPVPHTIVDEDAREVVYIDHNHLHRVGGDPGICSAE